jgi:hypothetical protein
LAETLLGLRLSGGVEALPSEEFIRGDTLLGAETGPGLSKFFLYLNVSISLNAIIRGNITISRVGLGRAD